jgi:Tol biopolymer transport system component
MAVGTHGVVFFQRRGCLAAAAILLSLVVGGCGSRSSHKGSTQTNTGVVASEPAPSILNSTAWSADGRLVAFVQYDGLVVVAPDGTGLRHVNGDFGDPEWSPARDELALVGSRGGRSHEILRVGASGTPIRTLSRSRGRVRDPTWSPDGERVAFASDRSGNYDIYVVDRAGGNLRRLTRHHFAEVSPDWSSDGRWIVFRRHSRDCVGCSTRESIVLVSADGRLERQLISLVPDETFNSCCWRVEFSPQGRLIATDLGARILVVDPATGTTRTLAKHGMKPRWSPDGAHLLFEGWRPVDCAGRPPLSCFGFALTGLWIMASDGNGKVSLSKRDKVPIGAMDPSWSPDSRRVVFVVEQNGGARSVVLLRLRGTASRP